LSGARRRSSVCGGGTIEFWRPRNSGGLPYPRRQGREPLLIVANLSAAPQPVELDLKAFAGSTPIEMLGAPAFPTIRTAPYFLSLGPHGFYWFRLERPGDGDEPFGIERTAI